MLISEEQPCGHLHFSHMAYSNRLSTTFLSLAIVLLLFLASPTRSCTEQERNSLLQFLGRLSQGGNLTLTWKNGTDCCTWEGISCSPDRMVTDVFLASRSLQGFISPFLGNLTGLLRLNLSYNLLSGSLPLELVSSNSIIVLDVSFNRLNGNLQELPSSTPPLPLKVLNISSNLFSGQFPSTTWEVMKSLVALNVSNNSFTGQVPTILCVNAPSITLLELSYNQISGSIPPELGDCSKLKSLSVGHNNLSGTLPDGLLDITSLEHLSFPNNQLQGSLSNISKLKNLVTLNLGGNVLDGNIPDSIGELKRLEQIHLGNNNMSGELPSTLNNCTNLMTIDLKNNNFRGELTKVNFSNFPNLKILDLMWNKFSGAIPESIYSCSSLTALRLSSNSLHGQLSERIDNLKSLSFLSLANTSLTNITSALQILSNCKNLTTLLLGYNFEHEIMPQDQRIDGFEKLQVFSINGCSLYGKIPPWLTKLNNLEMLFLNDNKLTGPIPDCISNLISLIYLDMSNNIFTGEIPTALMEMPMLKTNDVPIVLKFPIYSYLTPLRQYRTTGSFPKTLNLANNKFTGVIPQEIGQLQALLTLNLTFNNLHGEIPQSIGNLTNLQVLDLSYNDLTGAIPSSLERLYFLSKFNISSNDLEGSIPTGGQFSTFPDSSFFGNPKLCSPMLMHHCNSAEAAPVSTMSAGQYIDKVILAVAFGMFFGVGILYDQMVLSKYIYFG